ncbi:alpha/beta hydrolase [Tsukamurella soli]|uniref:Alpha/beta hydrolase n=1 Tax=Tsukamurella soli TaxID=644556 RepID=A0ABP8JSF4_9ACTN
MADGVAVARHVVELLVTGDFDAVTALGVPEFQAAAAGGAIVSGWQTVTAACGGVVAVGETTLEPGADGAPGAAPAGDVVVTTLTGERGSFDLRVTLGPGGLLRGLRYRPHDRWAPPRYADPDRFIEYDVTVGPGELAVPGTLTVPVGDGPFPGVVLLAGSGPIDRDETLTPDNKPLKDIAWGLATRGVAALRFDKITRVNPRALPADVTVDDEYLPQALGALHLLREHPAIDGVYLLGHSLGATVAPRIATEEPGVRGLILLAGATEQVHHAALRQIRYLVSLGTTAVDSHPAVVDMAQRVARIDAPDFSDSIPSDVLPFGAPAAYWRSLIEYDPAATAAALRIPILLLQGGRDYQVTAVDNLPAWRDALAGCGEATITVYEEDDHQFFVGTGPSTPNGYLAPQHVDLRVIDDVAAWCR